MKSILLHNLFSGQIVRRWVSRFFAEGVKKPSRNWRHEESQRKDTFADKIKYCKVMKHIFSVTSSVANEKNSHDYYLRGPSWRRKGIYQLKSVKISIEQIFNAHLSWDSKNYWNGISTARLNCWRSSRSVFMYCHAKRPLLYFLSASFDSEGIESNGVGPCWDDVISRFFGHPKWRHFILIFILNYDFGKWISNIESKLSARVRSLLPKLRFLSRKKGEGDGN